MNEKKQIKMTRMCFQNFGTVDGKKIQLFESILGKKAFNQQQ